MMRKPHTFTCLLVLEVLGACGSASSGTTPGATTSPAAAPVAPSVAQPTANAAAATPPSATGTQQATTPPQAASAAPSVSAGSAGSPAAMPAQMAPSAPAAEPTTPAQPSDSAAAPTTPTEVDHTKDVRGTCNLNTGYPDDKACIAAPKPSEGFQIHIGPTNYDDPAEVAKFIIKPGEEKTECYTLQLENEQELTYQTHTLSGRAGTHHIINSTWKGELPTGMFTVGCGAGANPLDMNAPMQTGSLPGASKAYMERRPVAPEFADVGRTVPAKALMTSDMHYYNFTDKDILREYWINLYFPPEGTEIKRYAKDIVAFGGLGWNFEPIQPGTDMVYKYECPIVGNGHVMNLLGHYHIHGKRFGISIKRANGMSEKVFEMYDPYDPAVFDYNSITMNPAFSAQAAGAVSGMLPVSDGDVLQWECHIINDSMVALGYTNEVKTGEMCNTWGFTVGTEPVQCGVP